MNVNKLMLATAIMGSLGGLYGCSEGDEATVFIDSDTTNNSTTGGGGSSTVSENCPAWSAAKNKDSAGNDVCALPSQILLNRTLNADIVWYMDSRVIVGNGNSEMSDVQGVLSSGVDVLDVTLTIEAGTSIKASTGTFANLLITRGSKIQAVGTASAPIVFSSDDAGEDGSGEWGGLIIHGYGDHNQCDGLPCNIDAEGESGFAGGFARSDDNSGTLSYVLVTEGGYEFAPGDEINGISLVSVGSGTIIDHIQVHGNADDGIEFYGGDVNVKYLVLTANADDSIDWDEGYQGNLQYVIVKQSEESEGNTIEADTIGNEDNFLSKPTIANATFIGNGSSSRLHRMKEATGGFIHNSVLTVDAANTTILSCVYVHTTVDDKQNISLVYDNIIADCDTFQTADDNVSLSTATVNLVPANLDSNYASQAAEAQLGAAIDWAVVKATYAQSLADETYLDATDYMGAVDPNATSFWYAGWTLDGTL